MMRRVLVCLALTLSLAACETPREVTRPGEAGEGAAHCNPGSANQREAIDRIVAAVAGRAAQDQTPTAEERAALLRLAQETANTRSDVDAAGLAYCRFQSARAANLATRTALPDDGVAVGLLAGAAQAAETACRANASGPAVMQCRQLAFYQTLGVARSVSHPLIVTSRGAASAVDVPRVEQGYADYAQSAGSWSSALNALGTAGADAQEQGTARQDLAALACHVQAAGARMTRPEFGLPAEERDRVEIAAVRGDAAAAIGLQLPLSVGGEAVCAAEPASLNCARQHQQALLRMCR